MNTQNTNFNFSNFQNINQINHQLPIQNLNPQFNNLNMNMYNQQIPQNNIYNSNITQTSKSNNFNIAYNNNNNNIYQNNNLNFNSLNNNNNNNLIDNEFRPYSGNDLIYAKELKQRKQEEYRKILDEQIQNSNQMKEQNKNKYKNYESNTFLNFQDDNNKTITKPYINDVQKEIERKKKMEYNEILRKQVEERKKREEMEKQKQKEEDIKFEVKMKQQLEERKIQEEYHKKLESMGKHNKNMESPDNIMYTNNPIPNNNTIEQQFFSSSPQSNIYLQNTLNSNTNNLNNYTQVSSFPTQYIQQQMFNQPNNFSNNNNYNTLQLSDKFDFNNKQNPNFNNNNYYGQRPLTQYHSNSINNEFLNENLNNTNINNFNRTHSTRNQTFNINNNQINNISNINIEELFERYVNDCQNLITQYENTMENYPFNPSIQNDNNDTIRNLINEKEIINDKIKRGQEELKNHLGFYPNLSEFNMKITKYLTLVLERKIREIQEISKNYEINNKKYLTSIQSANNKNKNKNNFNQSEMKKERNAYSNNLTSTTINSLTTSQLDQKIRGCQYRSKYEDLRKSVFKNEDINQNLKESLVKESLAGWSKLVTTKNESFIQNNPNINSNNFYQTWKEYDNNDNMNSNMNLESIEEEKKENEIHMTEEVLKSIKNNESRKISKRESKRDNENVISQNKININNNKNINNNISNNINNNNNTNLNNKRNINSSKKSNKDNNISIEKVGIMNKNINNNINNSNITNNNKSKKLDPRISAKIINEKDLKISKDEKDKSVYFVAQEQNSLMNNTNKIENSNLRISTELKNRKSYHGSQENLNNITRDINPNDNYIIKDLEDDNCNILSKDIINLNSMKKSKKEEEDDDYEQYENDFTTDKNIINNIEKGEKSQNKIDLNDYKEIHESQKLQNQLNFFEDNILDNNINIKKSNKQKLRPTSPKGKNSQLKKIENNNNNKIQDSLLSSNNFCNDSYGENIIKNLNKFRELALEESSIVNTSKK